MRNKRNFEGMKSPGLSKLLRVLVAAGMALAGTAGVRAQEKPAPADQKDNNTPPASTPADKTDDAKAKEQEKAKADKEKQQQEQKKKAEAEDQKKASQDGGGVKGW
jgi:hypothetical protein